MQSSKLTNHKPTSISSEWLAKCKNEDEREELRQYLYNSTRLFDLLKGMIQRRYDSDVAARRVDYEKAAWPYLQAHINGRLEALEDVFKLLP